MTEPPYSGFVCVGYGGAWGAAYEPFRALTLRDFIQSDSLVPAAVVVIYVNVIVIEKNGIDKSTYKLLLTYSVVVVLVFELIQEETDVI